MLLDSGQIWLQLWYKESTTKHDEERGVGQNGEQRDRAQNCKTEKSRTKTSMELLPEDGQDLFKTKVRLQTGGGNMDLRCKHQSASAQCCAAESGSYPLREQAILYKERNNSRLTLKDSLIMKTPRTATTPYPPRTHHQAVDKHKLYPKGFDSINCQNLKFRFWLVFSMDFKWLTSIKLALHATILR